MKDDLQGVMDFIIARDKEIEADYQGVVDFIIARDNELAIEDCFVVSGDNKVTTRVTNKMVTGYKQSVTKVLCEVA